MPEPLGTSVLTLKTDSTNLNTGMNQARTGATGLQSLFGKTSLSAVAMGAAIGVAMIKAGRAVIRFGEDSAQMARDFETSMTSIIALVGVAADQVAAWSDAILDLAPAVRKGPQELADAMFFITSAGLRGQLALDALTVSAKASAAGLGDLTAVADAVTSAMNSYGAEALSAEAATDVLLATVREGKLEAGELAGVIGRLAPLASEMGVEFHEVGGILAAMTRVGFGAADASTALRSIMTSLLGPTSEAAEMLASVGTSAAELLVSIKERGLTVTLQELADTLDNDTVALGGVFANVRALAGVLPLIGEKGGVATEIMDALAESAGATQKAFELTAETMEEQLKVSTITLEVEMIRLGESIGGLAVPVQNFIRGAGAAYLRWINDVLDFHREVVDNRTILGDALLGIGDLADFERALVLQQKNVDFTREELRATQELRDTLVSARGANTIAARAQQRRVNDAIGALSAQVEMLIDIEDRTRELRAEEQARADATAAADAAAKAAFDAVTAAAAAAIQASKDAAAALAEQVEQAERLAEAIEAAAIAQAEIVALRVAEAEAEIGAGALAADVIAQVATLREARRLAVVEQLAQLNALREAEVVGFTQSAAAVVAQVEVIREARRLAAVEQLALMNELRREEVIGFTQSTAGFVAMIKSWRETTEEFFEFFQDGFAEATQGRPGIGPVAGPFQATPNVGGINPELMVAFSDALLVAIPELAMLASTAAILGLIFLGFMDVVGDLMAGPLAMMIGGLVFVGEILGKIFAPLLEVSSNALMGLAEGFIWFFNKVLRRVANLIIGIFKVVQMVMFIFADTIIALVNGLIRLINLIPGINIAAFVNPISQPDFTTGFIDEITLGGLTERGIDAGATDPGASRGAGATFRQQRPIDVTVNINDTNILGGNFQDFVILVRDGLENIAELGL